MTKHATLIYSACLDIQLVLFVSHSLHYMADKTTCQQYLQHYRTKVSHRKIIFNSCTSVLHGNIFVFDQKVNFFQAFFSGQNYKQSLQRNYICFSFEFTYLHHRTTEKSHLPGDIPLFFLNTVGFPPLKLITRGSLHLICSKQM